MARATQVAAIARLVRFEGRDAGIRLEHSSVRSYKAAPATASPGDAPRGRGAGRRGGCAGSRALIPRARTCWWLRPGIPTRMLVFRRDSGSGIAVAFLCPPGIGVA